MSTSKETMTANPTKKISNQMRGVLTIFAANRFLKDSVLRFIDIQNESIDWKQIFSATKGSSYMAASIIAYGIWTDSLWQNSDPFEGAVNLDREIKEACLRALALRWGLTSS